MRSVDNFSKLVVWLTSILTVQSGSPQYSVLVECTVCCSLLKTYLTLELGGLMGYFAFFGLATESVSLFVVGMKESVTQQESKNIVLPYQTWVAVQKNETTGVQLHPLQSN